MKKIELNKGRVTLVDDDDYERLSKHKWYAQRDPHTHSFYAKRYSKRDANGKQHVIYMAREIMHARPGQEVDHTNHDTVDNRKQNLRLCTRAENHYNQKKHKKGSSRHKGVSWNKQARKWVAYIQYKGHQRHLGYFVVEAEAARAYDRAAIKYFGEFAELNFPNKKSS